jgi:hypothetical protein
MIYGYEMRAVNERGLKQMREISIQSSPETVRELAAFLLVQAADLEAAASRSWHRHAPDELQRKLGFDVIVLAS